MVGTLALAGVLGAAWYFTQPNYAKGPDQITPMPGLPGWLLYPIAVMCWIAFMCAFLYEQAGAEAARRRRELERTEVEATSGPDDRKTTV